MTPTFTPEWNSFISAIIGGALALLGTWLTLRGAKREREKEDSRELISLFYFLSSKIALLAELGEHTEGIPMMNVVSEDELLNVRKSYAVASRAVTLSDIGEIDGFCNKLHSLESIRKDCLKDKGDGQININAYHQVLLDTLNAINSNGENKGINEIGKRIEYYFSKELKSEYAGKYKYK